MAESITIDVFRELFTCDEEFAVIDPRKLDEFSRGHILAASNLPLQQLENRIEFAVAQKHTRCVLCDAGGGEALEATALLESLGYSSLMILQGGIDAWQASGGALFSGASYQYQIIIMLLYIIIYD